MRETIKNHVTPTPIREIFQDAVKVNLIFNISLRQFLEYTWGIVPGSDFLIADSFWEKLARIVIILALPPVIIFGNLYWLESPAYVDYELAGAPAGNDLKPASRVALAKKVVEFLRGRADRNSLTRFESRELDHLEDVKKLFNRLETIQRLASALFAAAAIYLAILRHQRLLFIRTIGTGGALTLILTALIAALSLFDFGSFFSGFHELFFSPGTWLFPPDSLLIKVFPLSFWMAAARMLLILTGIESLVLTVGLWLGRR